MTLVLVPGFMTDPDLWQDVEGGLQGLGPTFHADLRRDGSITAMALRALADAPTSFILIGFSMGGYVAREMARIAPDRVQALVLIATSARGETALQAKRKAATAAMVAASPAVSLSRSSIALSLHPDRAGDQALVERIQAMGARLGPEVFHRQLMLDRPADLDRLHEVRCRTLVLAGAQDRLRSLVEAAELSHGIPGATLRVIEGTGHMIPMECPAQLVKAILSCLGDTTA
jgi:pimeloyl-ACP methyl ester carboxylesterase